jgi:hypothetical protein
MRPAIFGTVVLVTIILTLPARAADEKANGKPGNQEIDSNKVPPGYYLGRVVGTPGSDRTLTLEIETAHLELKNPGQPINPVNNQNVANAMRNQHNITNLQANVARARNPKEAAQAWQKLQNAIAQAQQQVFQHQQAAAQQNPFKVVKDTHQISFQMADDVAVRILNLPIEYDDKGEMKKLTPDEIKERKGKDPKMIGFASSPADLKGGQIVRITLERRQPNMGNADKNAKEDKDKPAAGPPNEVTMVIILDESGVGNDSPGQRKPKKNK